MVEFLQNWELWIEAVIASVLIGAIGGVFGVFIIARRVVFISMALSQVSALGVAAAILTGELLSHASEHHHDETNALILLNPALWSLVLAVVASLFLGLSRKPNRVTAESLIGMIYLLAGGLVLVIASRMAAHSHEIDNVLFGNAVAITTKQLIELMVVLGIVVAVFARYLKDFLFVTFDEDAAQTMSLPVRRINIVFYVALAALISVATRTIGGFPVFAFLILPAMGALIAAQSVTGVFVLAVVFGMASAFFGYLTSFVWALPTGACMVAVAGACIALSFATQLKRR